MHCTVTAFKLLQTCAPNGADQSKVEPSKCKPVFGHTFGFQKRFVSLFTIPKMALTVEHKSAHRRGVCDQISTKPPPLVEGVGKGNAQFYSGRGVKMGRLYIKKWATSLDLAVIGNPYLYTVLSSFGQSLDHGWWHPTTFKAGFVSAVLQARGITSNSLVAGITSHSPSHQNHSWNWSARELNESGTMLRRTLSSQARSESSRRTSCVRTTRLSLRGTPEQKLHIFRTLQVRGSIVGVTRDGVSDAPALRVADCGITMGSGSGLACKAVDSPLSKAALSSSSCSGFPFD
ncbi:hypothetical protein BGW80DRAFT_1247557 [Lactifluus volemus]|nr:hypothetical protein BGW80DRAFT_1247557 [Lactifluus volemus]